MNQTPLVSICVVMYNVEAWLSDCLNSILRQSYLNWECLIVNDGSTDSSPIIARKFCDIDFRFRLIDKKNGGASTARNVGIEASKGEFIYFVDSDDMLAVDCLAYCVQSIGRADILAAGCISITAGGKTIRQTNQGKYRLLNQENALKEYFNRTLLTSVWSKFYRRTVIGDIRFCEKLRGGEDLHFNINLCLKVTNHPIYFYRIVHTSLSHIKEEERIKRLMAQIEEMDVLYGIHSKTIHSYCLDEFARNMMRDILFYYSLQGMIKRMDPWYIPFMAKYNKCIKNENSKEYRLSSFILRHSTNVTTVIMTLLALPVTVKSFIKRMVR